MTHFTRLRLLIVHNHFRPGGVRRVIELGTSHIIAAVRPAICEVVLASGEEVDPAWLAGLKQRVAPTPVHVAIDPGLAYVSERKLRVANLRLRTSNVLPELLEPASHGGTVVWAHNLSLGRNLPLAQALREQVERAGATLVFHHHDWWFDNRWQRWPEMRESGFRRLDDVAATLFPPGPGVRHVAINKADRDMLRLRFPGAMWLPNPIDSAPQTASRQVLEAKRWLQKVVGGDFPVWIMPVRLIRRKNIAEAVLLTRWLRPDAFLVTTAGPSSADEQDYAQRLATAAAEMNWRVRLGVLGSAKGRVPAVPALLRASEAVLMTSLQEGFGLPYLEAAAAQRPLVSRFLSNVAPDLQGLGIKFPQMYSELLVDPGLFDSRAEILRQKRLFQRWRARLPASFQGLASEPELLGKKPGDPVPFSRLTLAAQLQVLAVNPDISWRACLPLNPFLKGWRNAASRGRLAKTVMPAQAVRYLSGIEYGRQFARLLGHASSVERGGALRVNSALELQRKFAASKLADIYPLLCETER